MKRYILATDDSAIDDIFDGDRNHRLSVAFTTSDPDLLRILAYDPDAAVRGRVAENYYTPDEQLLDLSNDSDYHVYADVAGNSNASADTLRNVFARIEDFDDNFATVDSRLASNPNTPIDVLSGLYDRILESPITRRNYFILDDILDNPNTTPELVDDMLEEEDIQAYFAEYSVAPELLNRLADSPYASVRMCVAMNSETSEAALNELADDPDSDVRENVAKNTNTPLAAAKRLALDPAPEICTQVYLSKVSDNDATDEVLDVMAKNKNPAVRYMVTKLSYGSERLFTLAHDDDVDVRCGVAENTYAPMNVLRELSHDPDYSVRLLVARNPSTSQDILEAMEPLGRVSAVDIHNAASRRKRRNS